MKSKLLFSILFIAVLQACSLDKMKPEFVGFKNIKVQTISKSKILIKAELLFYNPNPVSINLESFDIDVKLNEFEVGNLSQNQKAEIGKKKNFNLPIEIYFNPKDIFKTNAKNLLSTAGSIFLDKKYELNYKGNAVFDIAGKQIKIPINYSESVEIEFICF